MIASHACKGTRRYRYYVSSNLQHGGNATDTEGMRIPAPEIEVLVSNKLAELFDDPIALVEKTAASAAPPDVTAKAVSGSCAIAEALRGSDTTSIAGLIDRIVPRIDVAADAVTIILDSHRVAESLGIDGPANSASLQITVPAKLKRSGMAMRLVLETGQTASSRIDDNLVKAIATAHRWWGNCSRSRSFASATSPETMA